MRNFILITLAIFGLVSCTKKSEPPPPLTTNADVAKAAMPADIANIVELGKLLYFDKRLSKNDTISCNTCHNVTGKSGGVDGLETSTGINNQKGGRNAPTVWNAKFLSVQFWDGRAKDLAEQAKGPLTNPVEMGMANHDDVMAKVRTIKGYETLFSKAFPTDLNPMNIENLAKAIAKFEETLSPRNSRYDKFKAGEQTALNELENKGFELFQTTGCITCHSGENFSGPQLETGVGFYMKFPTFPGSEYEKKYELTKDLGRFDVTKSETDKNMWRVPTLRNIELTAPYFHTGKVKDLDEAVRVMAKVQLNKELKKEEVESLVAFLKTLTDDLPEITEPTPVN